MEEIFQIQKLKAQYPEFFEQLTKEFLDFISSGEIASQISEICSECGIDSEEKIEKIAYRITLVLLDQIPKENLTQVLVNGVGLDFETANSIAQKAEELIFPKVPKIKWKEKPAPTKLLEFKREMPKFEEKGKVEKAIPKEIEEPKEPPRPIQRDIYREPIE
jgi:hypothetical protein